MPRKVAIVHDMFLYRGGGERLVLLMAKALDADIITGFYDAGCYDPESLGVPRSRIRVLFEHPPRSSIRRKFSLGRAFRRISRELSGYDAVIFSGDCLPAAAGLARSQRAICYCHTPPRYLFDQYAAYLAKMPVLLRPAYALAGLWYRRAYRRDIARMDAILVNSLTIERRLYEHTGESSSIVYPCVDTEFFSPAAEPAPKSGYYLSYARLASIKRVDRIVEAFARMPERRLVLVHGRHDPQREEILARVALCPNIETRESPTDEELRDLIRGATATIYVPKAEDFGMTPLESMACGTPVIAAADGGLLETVVDSETGYFVSADATIDEIAATVARLDATTAAGMHDACVARADDFSYRTFAERIRAAVESA